MPRNDRDSIVKFWGIERRVEKQRRGWLEEDLKGYFPHAKILFHSKGGSFGSVYLSRQPFPVLSGTMRDEDRVVELTKGGLSSGVVVVPTENEMLGALTSVIHGLKTFPKRGAHASK